MHVSRKRGLLPIKGFISASLLTIAAVLAFGAAVAEAVRGDFDGDGRSDLAVGVPEEDVGSGDSDNDGTVSLFYGSNGLSNFEVFFHGDSAGIAGDGAEANDRFGDALAAGDFDGDGRADLAVGTSEDLASGTDDDDGAVHVLYGSAGGLSTSRDQLFTQDSEGIAGDGADGDPPFGGDRFGDALAAGDFDGDGRADLAIGAPDEGVASGDHGDGAVHILYGSANGLNTNRDRFFTQDSNGIAGDGAESVDRFGSDLAAGNFDGDGRSDLAIGVRGEAVGGHSQAGAVNVLYGSPEGLNTDGDRFFTQETAGMAGDGAGAGDSFGGELAAGNFNGDGRSDLAIGVPAEDVASGGNNGDGAVNVLYGSAEGLNTDGDRFFTQNTAGMAGDGAELGDAFGEALAAGDFDGDERSDLAVGAVLENVTSGDNTNDGAVNVLYGSLGGLNTEGDRFFTQDTGEMAGDGAEPGDAFGGTLGAGDFDANGRIDLAVGVPSEDVASGADDGDGAVNTLYGTGRGLRTGGSEFIHQGVPGGGGLEAEDGFGRALAP